MKGQRADTFLHHHGLQDAFSKNISFDDPQNGVIFHVENRSRMKGPPQKEPSPVCTAVLNCLYKFLIDFTGYYSLVMFPLFMPF